MQNYQKVKRTTDFLRQELGESNFKPVVAIILGTGLSSLGQNIFDAPPLHAIPFSSLPNFPATSVASHTGQFLCGYMGGIPVIAQAGRIHLYENRAPEEICMGVRIMGKLGAKILVATNAAGGLNPLFEPGTLMAIADHINFTGVSPLTGKNEENWGERFPDMSNVYERSFIKIARDCALELKIEMEEGIYIGVHGPELETPAETRMYRQWGADAIGMSTIMEVIAAKHLGMKIFGVSCITNINLPDCMEPASLEGILETAEKAGEKLMRLLPPVVEKIAEGVSSERRDAAK